MNILFLSAVVPYPLVSGGQVRIYNLLKRLTKDFSITLCAFSRSESEKKYVSDLSFCTEVHLIHRGHVWQPTYVIHALTGKYPLVMSSYDVQAMRDCINVLLSKKSYDRIHIEPGYVWPSLPDVDIPITVGEHNIEHEVYEQYLQKYSYPVLKTIMKSDINKLNRWEKKIWNEVDSIVAVSSRDAEYIRLITTAPVTVVPNGIDKDILNFVFTPIDSHNIRCLFIGNFRWIQNKDAVAYLLQHLWPKINRKFPSSHLRIVGQDFPNRLMKYVNESVTIVPYVERVEEEFHSNDILLAPIRVGGGTKYKILESMACGLPVVTTTNGVQGLNLQKNNHCYVVETEDEWTDAVDNLISNPKKTEAIVREARRFVEENYSWDRIATTLKNVWNNAKE